MPARLLRSTLLASPASRRLGLMAGLAVVLAACSSSPAATTNTPNPTASATATATASAAASASRAAAPGTVKLVNIAFDPEMLTVKVGTTVTFRNLDSVEHTATHGINGVADPHALFDIDLAPGASGTYKFTKAGTFNVTCRLHSVMNMTIVVQ